MAASKPILIGIAGGSCSGKTTFCAALEKALSALAPREFHNYDYLLPTD